jgi:hypothetical protein
MSDKPKFEPVVETSPWTSQHHRVTVENNGWLVFVTVETKTVIWVDHEKASSLLGRLMVFNFNPIREGDRMVRHYLEFFEDDELLTLGMEAFRKLHAEYVDRPPPIPTAPPTSDGGMVN